MSAPPESFVPLPALKGVPEHILSLLSRLHTESAVQESAITPAHYRGNHKEADLHAFMRDKFIALEPDKCQFIYQLLQATNAKTVVEAGTSYGVSTVYLALAVAANVAATGGKGRVVATEHEATKAAQARKYWEECGDAVTGVIDLREGDLRETLKENLEDVDLLLLDIWTPMALPTLKVVQPKLRRGAIILADNTTKAVAGYEEFLSYIRAPDSGFINSTLPFSGGFEMSVYLP